MGYVVFRLHRRRSVRLDILLGPQPDPSGRMVKLIGLFPGPGGRERGVWMRISGPQGVFAGPNDALFPRVLHSHQVGRASGHPPMLKTY